jgi:hypothetical protein
LISRTGARTVPVFSPEHHRQAPFVTFSGSNLLRHIGSDRFFRAEAAMRPAAIKFFMAIGMLCTTFALSLSAQTVTLLSADYGVEGNRVDVTCRVQSLVQNGYLGFRITNWALGGDPAPEMQKELRIRARDYRGQIFDYNYPEKQDINLQVTPQGPNCVNTGSTSQWQGRLNDDDQQRFDSYYTRWLSYRQRNDQAQIYSMENRMRDVYNHYGIPNSLPFNQVASPLAVQSLTTAYSDLKIMAAIYGAPGHTADVSARLRSLIQNGTLTVHVNNDSMGVDPAPHLHKVLNLTYIYRGQQRSATVRERDDLSIP